MQLFFVISRCRISRLTQRYLRLSMAWIAGMSLVILQRFLSACQQMPLGCEAAYIPQVEYILAAVALAIGGACIIERSLRGAEGGEMK